MKPICLSAISNWAHWKCRQKHSLSHRCLDSNPLEWERETYAYCLYFIAVHTRHTRAAKTGYSRMYTPRHMRSDSPKWKQELASQSASLYTLFKSKVNRCVWCWLWISWLLLFDTIGSVFSSEHKSEIIVTGESKAHRKRKTQSVVCAKLIYAYAISI